MIRFFPNISAIQKFTSELNLHKDSLKCKHCTQSDQWVSHGFIYKYISNTQPEKVGKRIFCSNRCQHRGCGRTFQLYLSTEIPSFRLAAASRLFVFISALITLLSVKEAYRKVAGQEYPRNAWRWINRLMRRLSNFRSVVSHRSQPSDRTFNSRSRRLQLLLPTLQQLFSLDTDCANYQLIHQDSFI